MLDQRLRLWPDIKPTFVECAVFAGKALLINMGGGKLFLAPHCNTTVSVSTQSPSESLGEIINSVDVTQVYGLAMIWELAPNAALGMKRIWY